MKKFVFYTGLFGDVGDFPEISDKLSKEHDFYLFTDQEVPTNNNYKIVKTKKPDLDNAISNRVIKFNPHKYFKEYKFAIYHDVSIKILEEFIIYLNKIYENLEEFNFFLHPYRENVNDELDFLFKHAHMNFFTYRKLKKLLISDFIYRYNLTENNIFIVNPNSSKIEKIFSHNIYLLRNLFHRDQITLPLSFEKYNTYPNMLSSLNVRENNLLLQYKHHKYHHKNSISSSLLSKLNKIIYNSGNLVG